MMKLRRETLNGFCKVHHHLGLDLLLGYIVLLSSAPHLLLSHSDMFKLFLLLSRMLSLTMNYQLSILSQSLLTIACSMLMSAKLLQLSHANLFSNLFVHCS